MTRKDYVLIAKALKGSRDADTNNLVNLSYTAQYLHTCSAITRALATDNPAFNRARFLEACGV